MPPDHISTITNEVLDEVARWQQRFLEPMCPILSSASPESAVLASEFDQGTVRLHESGQLKRILKAYGLHDWMPHYRKEQ